MGPRVLWFDPRGIAHSTWDLLDPITPIIPKLLEVRKTRVNPQSLVEKYYATGRFGKFLRVRFNPRIESLSTWRALRGADESGLTPDEALTVKVLLGHANGRFQAITDYPNEEAQTIQIGRRVYFESSLEVREFVANLRILGQRNRRNAYLPRNCMLDLSTFELPTLEDLDKVSEELGEWCYYSTET
jgi:hypothetical protein